MTFSDIPPSVPTSDQSELVVQFNSSAMADFEQDVRANLGKEVGDLTNDEAMILATSGVIISMTRADRGTSLRDNIAGITIETDLDGQEAVKGAGEQKARELAPRIDDERKLVIKGLGKTTLADLVFRRTPKVAKTYEFSNHRPELA